MNIIICGSMSASKKMVEIEKKLIALGYSVILPESTHEYAQMDTIDKTITESARDKADNDLIRGYFNKIKEGDAVLIVNVEKNNIEGYIGGNAFLEMGFAYVLNKPLYLLHDIPEMNYRDEIEAMSPVILHGDLSKIEI
jgi:nucleoside 2-deoxyribosyltransferase